MERHSRVSDVLHCRVSRSSSPSEMCHVQAVLPYLPELSFPLFPLCLLVASLCVAHVIPVRVAAYDTTGVDAGHPLGVWCVISALGWVEEAPPNAEAGCVVALGIQIVGSQCRG